MPLVGHERSVKKYLASRLWDQRGCDGCKYGNHDKMLEGVGWCAHKRVVLLNRSYGKNGICLSNTSRGELPFEIIKNEQTCVIS